MKILRILSVAFFSLSLISLSGCSTFKSFWSKKKGAGGSQKYEATQASGLGSDESFSEYGASYANRLNVPYNQTYRFEFNSFAVEEDDIQSIEAQANYLIAHPKARVRLEGHTDERGSREYNIALGWKRAKAVSVVLRQAGVNSSQIAIVSLGKEKPVAFGHDEDSYSKNRRVNLVYESK